MSGKRDSAYYRARLRREHPTFFADLVARKYSSVREAAAAAGLIRLPTRLDALKREWNKASEIQQIEFIKWSKVGTPKGVVKPIADSDGRLRADVRAFLSHWVTSHRSKPGRIMKEIGLAGFDWTLSAAITRGHGLRPAVIPKLSGWLTKQGFR
jgi:hypothetical protein